MAGKDLGYARTAPAGSPPARARRMPLWRGLAVLLRLAAGLTVLIKAWAAEAFRIPSGSIGLAGMLPLARACRRQSAHVTADRR